MAEIKNMVERIASGELTAVQAAQEAIGRIEAGDGEVNAVVVRDFDRALVAAGEADARLARGERAPLLGLPMTVKESFDVAGLPTTWGLPEGRGNIASSDALVVRRLKEAGAVILGKTNVPPELGDFQSVNEIYGATHNPRMHGRSSGGSSGGSAAALAAGYVIAEVGTDIGGSIRLPAGFCGVWGLKPTFGLVSREGHFKPGTDAGELPLSVPGPLALSAEDLGVLLEVIADHPVREPRRVSLDGARIAVISHHPAAGIDHDVRRVIDETCTRAEEAGALIDREPDLPDLQAMFEEYVRLLVTTRTRGVAPEGMEPVTLPSWFDMLDQQSRVAREWRTLLSERYDGVLAPVFATTAFPLDDLDVQTRRIVIDGEPAECAYQLAWAGLATYPNLPAVSFPAGKGSDGMPIGLQLIGRHYAEREILPMADAIALR